MKTTSNNPNALGTPSTDTNPPKRYDVMRPHGYTFVKIRVEAKSELEAWKKVDENTQWPRIPPWKRAPRDDHAPEVAQVQECDDELTSADLQDAESAEPSAIRLYYRAWFGIPFLSEGAEFLAEENGAYWLLDVIAAYQRDLAGHQDERLRRRQFWHLKVNDDRSAVLTCVANPGEPPVVTHAIDRTDFPLPETEIWVAGEGRLMMVFLPSEY